MNQKVVWAVRAAEIVIIILLIALSTPLIHLLNQHLNQKMDELKSRTLSLMEDKLGRAISYRSISPSIFGFLAVRDLKIHSFSDPEAILLKINRVKIYYSIFDFLITKDPVNSLREVNIANSLFRIDRERDKEIFEFLDRLSGRYTQEETEASRHTLKFSGTNITLHYSSPGMGLELEKLFFSISRRRDFYNLAVRCSVEYDSSPYDDRGFKLFSRIKVNGQVDQRLTWSDMAVRIYCMKTDTFEIGRQTFQVSLKENEFSVRKIQDRAPLDLQFRLNLDSNELAFSFKTENFTPSDSFRLTGAMNHYNRYLNCSLTSSGSFTYKIDESRLTYLLDFQARLRDKRIPMELNIVSHLFGNEKIVYLEPFIVNSEKGSIEFMGNILIENYFPAGFLKLIDVRSITGQTLNAGFQLQRETKGLSVKGNRLVVGSTSFENINLDIVPLNGEYKFILTTSLAHTEIDNSIEARGAFSFKPKPVLEAVTDLSGIPLHTVYQLISPPQSFSPRLNRRLKPLSLNISLDIKTDFKQFKLISPEVRITDTNNIDNAVRFGITGDNTAFVISDITVEWDEYVMSGFFKTASAGNRTDFKSTLLFEGKTYTFEGFHIPGRELQIDGSHSFQVSILSSGMVNPLLSPGPVLPLHGSPFQVKMRSFPVPFKKGVMYISTDIDGIVTRGGALFLASKQTEFKNIPFISPGDNSLRMSFSVKRDILRFESLVFEDHLSTLEGSGEIIISDFSPVIGKGWINLGSQTDQERYSLTAELKRNEIYVEFDFWRAPLDRLGKMIISGDGSGRVGVKGSYTDPQVKAEFVLNGGRLNVDPLALEVSISYNKKQFNLESLNLGYLSHKIINGRGRMRFDSGEFAYTSEYRADYFGNAVDFDIVLEGKFKDIVRALPVQSIFRKDLAGELRFSRITVQGEPYPDWIFKLKTEKKNLIINGGPEDSIQCQILENGEFTLVLSEPLPIYGRASGTIEGDRLDSSFSVAGMDMKIINTLARTDIFNFTHGIARGDLRITGLINDPDFYGTLQVRDGGLIFALSPDEVAPINGSLVFNEKSFTMERLDSFSGRAKITAEGIFFLDHWIPVAYKLVFQTESRPGMWIRTNFGSVHTDGFASGIIKVQGDKASIRIDGDLIIDSCRIALEKVEASEDHYIPLILNMNLRTGRRVEFYWPSINFPIIRTYAKQGEEISLYLDEERGDFTILGDVEIRGGEIFYFDRSFYLKQGNIAFGESVEKLDPRITALAEIRERDQNNEELKIFLEVNNYLSEFSPRFYSEPPRSDIEILDFIGGSLSSRIEESGFGVSAVLLTSDVVSRFGILSPFERAVRELLGLDLFSIRTQIVQNLLVSRLLGENSSTYLINPLDNTTLSLGKYLGTDFFLEMLVRFEAEDIASTGYDSSNRIRTEGEINFEWTTPFFLIEWSINPQHPENLFLTDNTIGLRWKYSY